MDLFPVAALTLTDFISINIQLWLPLNSQHPHQRIFVHCCQRCLARTVNRRAMGLHLLAQPVASNRGDLIPLYLAQDVSEP
jgi:hypothetical protein